MKETKLGHIQTTPFDNFLIIPFEKKWLSVNDEKPIEFEIKLTKKGQLVLVGDLARVTTNTKEVSKNEM